MTEIVLDQYQINNIEAMIAWCQRSLPIKTWTMHFTRENSVVLEFSDSKYATYFVSTWQ
jgi:hypothetical protein